MPHFKQNGQLAYPGTLVTLSRLSRPATQCLPVALPLRPRLCGPAHLCCPALPIRRCVPEIHLRRSGRPILSDRRGPCSPAAPPGRKSPAPPSRPARPCLLLLLCSPRSPASRATLVVHVIHSNRAVLHCLAHPSRRDCLHRWKSRDILYLISPFSGRIVFTQANDI